jgi:hypothetical protein
MVGQQRIGSMGDLARDLITGFEGLVGGRWGLIAENDEATVYGRRHPIEILVVPKGDAEPNLLKLDKPAERRH